MTYDIALQISTYWFLMIVTTYVSIWGFWAIKRFIFD